MSIWVVALLIVIAMRAVAFFFPQMWATQIIGAVAIGFALIGFIENEVRGMKHFPLNPPEYYYGRKVAIIFMATGTFVFLLRGILWAWLSWRIIPR